MAKKRPEGTIMSADSAYYNGGNVSAIHPGLRRVGGSTAPTLPPASSQLRSSDEYYANIKPTKPAPRGKPTRTVRVSTLGEDVQTAVKGLVNWLCKHATVRLVAKNQVVANAVVSAFPAAAKKRGISEDIRSFTVELETAPASLPITDFEEVTEVPSRDPKLDLTLDDMKTRLDAFKPAVANDVEPPVMDLGRPSGSVPIIDLSPADREMLEDNTEKPKKKKYASRKKTADGEADSESLRSDEDDLS